MFWTKSYIRMFTRGNLRIELDKYPSDQHCLINNAARMPSMSIPILLRDPMVTSMLTAVIMSIFF